MFEARWQRRDVDGRGQAERGGTQTLASVALSLQLPQGWTATPQTSPTFSDVPPSTAPSARFSVTPPASAPNTNAVVHATAPLGPDASRESGVTVTVG